MINFVIFWAMCAWTISLLLFPGSSREWKFYTLSWVVFILVNVINGSSTP